MYKRQGCSLTAQQPYNNIVRTTLQALSAVLGGTQSLHTNSLDETLALPTEHAVRIALRTQQIIAYESGVPNTVDPLGGSYFVEALTNEMEREALDYIDKIDKMGGMLCAIDAHYPQKEIADAAYHYQKLVEKREKIIVGVNEFISSDDPPLEILKIGEEAAEKQKERLEDLRKRRDNAKVAAAMRNLKEVASSNKNVMPAILDAVRAYATLGEIMDVMRGVFGEYRDPGVF